MRAEFLQPVDQVLVAEAMHAHEDLADDADPRAVVVRGGNRVEGGARLAHHRQQVAVRLQRRLHMRARKRW